MSINITVEGGTTKRLLTAGKYCDRDIVITANSEEDAIIRRSIVQYSNDRIVSIGQQAFWGCSLLERVKFSKAETISSNAFRACSKLETADFDNATVINANAFNGCSSLVTLILRSGEVCRLSATTSLAGTPIESGTGFVYVPRALIEAYKAANYWPNYASQLRAIEDYTVDGTAVGELDETKI